MNNPKIGSWLDTAGAENPFTDTLITTTLKVSAFTAEEWRSQLSVIILKYYLTDIENFPGAKCISPNFSTKKKTANQPITAFLINKIYWNSSCVWLIGGGGTSGGGQLKKSPCKESRQNPQSRKKSVKGVPPPLNGRSVPKNRTEKS